jgi:hypothetical protein
MLWIQLHSVPVTFNLAFLKYELSYRKVASRLVPRHLTDEIARNRLKSVISVVFHYCSLCILTRS